MKHIIAAILLFLSSVCFAQSLRLIGSYPHPSSPLLYRIQAGSYADAANAEAAFNRLRSAGLNPVYENNRNNRRVVVAGISAVNVPYIVYIMYYTGFYEIWIREDKISSEFSIVNNGNGAVNVINDFDDKEPLAIVQTIPSFQNQESDSNIYQSNAPVVFFFNDKIFSNSIGENIDITVDGMPVDGTITISEGSNGYAVLTLTPTNPLPVGGKIVVVVKKGMQDDGGNQMQSEVNFSYVAEQGSQSNFDNNLGFESGDNGIAFTGDGAVDAAKGALVPFEGSRYTAISTGVGIVSNKAAINSRSSQILLGPIQRPFTSLAFHYDFISAEFNEYVGSRYDDNAMVTIYGPGGSHTEIITSVNKVRQSNTGFGNYPKMPDGGDSYAGHTGWRRFQIENINVGYPAYIIFSVTDVGDSRLSSILAVDALEMK